MVMVLFLKMGMLLSLSSTSLARLSKHINNGTLADIESFPYQVGLDIDGQFCGGSLISNTFVLTAAHCLEPFEAKDIIAHLGSATFCKGEQREAVDMIIHDEFDAEALKNDIGVVEIEYVEYTDKIGRIALPEISDHYSDYELEQVVASGWGRTNRWPGTSKTLLYVEISVLSNADCAAMYYPGTVTETNICTFSDYQGSPCPGDSGGPLVHIDSDTLIGIISFGPKRNCTCGAAYTRVTAYLEWIKDVTGV